VPVLSDADHLRALLGESIPEGGTAADTLFSSNEVNDLLEKYSDNLDRALAEGWEAKAAKLSDLVDIQDGDQRRWTSQAAAQALRMAKHFIEKANVGPARTKVRQIRRPGGFQG
jgi:hypothetical protein